MFLSNFQKKCLINSEKFEQLLKLSAAFIDKTLFIKEFFGGSLDEESDAKQILVTAPSRFGKSMMMNTLKVFCEPDVDEQGHIVTCVKKNEDGKWVEDKSKTPTKSYRLFKTVIGNKPLQIYSCTCPTKHEDDNLENGTCDSRQFFYQHCGQHPVIFISLKHSSCDDWDDFIVGLKQSLLQAYKQHKYLGDKRSNLPEYDREDFNLFCKGNKRKMKEGEAVISELDKQDLKFSLLKLVKYLYIQFKRKVLILIDEFDAPLIMLLHSSENVKNRTTYRKSFGIQV